MLHLCIGLRLRLFDLVFAHLPGALSDVLACFYAINLERNLLSNMVSINRVEDSFVNYFEIAREPQVLDSLYDFLIHLGYDFTPLVCDIDMERSYVVCLSRVGLGLVFPRLARHLFSRYCG